MTTFFAVTGMAFWIVVALGMGVILLSTPAALRWLYQPSRYPYVQFLMHRSIGTLLRLVRGLRLASREKVPDAVVDAFCAIQLDSMRYLRDVLQEVDALPTIAKGKQALGLKSIFEVPSRKVRLIESPYTHPLQQPPYLLPGVPARPFYDPQEFPWVQPLEDAFPVIRGELMELLDQQGAGFRGYVTEHHQRMAGWNTFNFFFFGKKFEENCARCPKTTALLESLPRFEKDHIMFSALNPHAHIPPHTGPMNGIIRAHLPLLVPEGCYIKVGDEERTWQEGKVLAFDDSFVHEVWNHGDGLRIVLFLNFWHPVFAEAEIPVLERFRVAYEKSPLARVHERNQGEPREHDLASKTRHAA